MIFETLSSTQKENYERIIDLIDDTPIGRQLVYDIVFRCNIEGHEEYVAKFINDYVENFEKISEYDRPYVISEFCNQFPFWTEEDILIQVMQTDI
ncbi:MAG: hypothetical protein WC284_12980 [Candidimonas sp.]